MNTNWQDIIESLSEQLSLPIQTISASPLTGGDIHHAYHLHTSEGDFFVKTNQAQSLPMFQTEANSLKKMADTQTLRVPKVYACGVTQHQAWLFLEHIPMQNKGDDFQRGKDLAFFHHQVNPEKQFGWLEDNYIGHTRQPNTWQQNWTTFYAEQRLQPQFRLAAQKGAGAELLNNGEQLIQRLEDFFQNYHPEASPLHGDLWAGNSAFTQDGEAVFYDPACYYGDREADLAMTELFGGFSQDFYAGYRSVFPLDEGYAQRKDLYNLYHVLNHYNLFGGHYEAQATRMIQTLLSSV